MEDRLWASLRRGERIVKSISVPVDSGVLEDDSRLYDALDALCGQLDIARPVWLSKHTQELKRYSHTFLKESDFIEAFPYKSLELEWAGENPHKDTAAYDEEF